MASTSCLLIFLGDSLIRDLGTVVKSGWRLHSSAKCQGSNERCLGKTIQTRRAALLILSNLDHKPSKQWPLGWSEWPDMMEIHHCEWCSLANFEDLFLTKLKRARPTIMNLTCAPEQLVTSMLRFVFIYNHWSIFWYICIFVLLLNFCPAALLFNKLAASLLLYSFLLGSMKGGYIRVEVDKWGKVSSAENPEVLGR